MSNKFNVGDLVNYHSIINQPATSFNHEIVHFSTDSSGDPVAWLKGKNGYVSLDALSHSKKAIATPAYNAESLSQESFEDMKKRMVNDCRGDLVREHATADAVFIVKKQKRIIGLDLDYCDESNTIVQFGQDADFIPFNDLIESLEPDEKRMLADYLELQARVASGTTIYNFHEKYSISDILRGFGKYHDVSIVVTGYSDEWEFLNFHLTNDSAQNYVKQHGHKHDGELRVFVDSMYRCNEINLVRNAIMNGKLVFNGGINE